MSDTLTDEEKLSILEDPEVWFETCASIEVTGPDGGKKLEAPSSNILQRRMFEVQRWCEANQVPCRGIVLKPRKKGCSTAVQAIGYHQMRTRPTLGILMGEDDGGGNTLFGMLKVYAETDLYPWGFGHKAVDSAGELDFANTSKALRSTAKRPAKARGTTPQFAHLTEVAHWPTKGEIDGRKTLTALLNAVPMVPGTTVWQESTPYGVAGVFPETYRGDPEKGLAGAVTLEERKAGKIGNGWIKVFAAWHEFKESDLALLPPEFLRGIGPAPTTTQAQREERGRQLFGWTDEQIKWRRATIAGNCGGDEGKFDEEYPEDEESAFRASGRRRFDARGLTRLEIMAKSARPPTIGRLDRQADDSVALSHGEGGWFWWWEMPIEGCRYLIPVDVSTGAEQQKGAANPDRHSVPVIRDGYSDAFGAWHNPAEVARIAPPCVIGMTLLADYVDRISRWLGGALTIVEVNGPGLTVIEGMKPWGTLTYERERGQAGTDRTNRIPGWNTNSSTKPTIIEALAVLIREDAFDCWDVHAVNELLKFVTHPDGTEAAETGSHDDDVMALAIGLANRGAATPYKLPTVRHYNPREIRERLARRGGQRLVNAETT